MILFKRVSESFKHIEDREWVLLFLETLGVLVGILLAFELQEWAGRRSDREQRHHQMERLLAEAEDNVALLRDERTVLKKMTDNERAFATALVHKGECPPASQWNAVNSVKKYPAVDVSEAVYQEMMGAGGLSSIENDYVRQAVSQFHAELRYFESQNSYFRQAHVDPVTSSDARVSIDFDAERHDPMSWSFDRSALCRDHGFRNRMAQAARNHWVMTTDARDALTEHAIKMCAAIAQQLGRTCAPKSGGPLTGNDAQMAAKALREMKAAGAD